MQNDPNFQDLKNLKNRFRNEPARANLSFLLHKRFCLWGKKMSGTSNNDYLPSGAKLNFKRICIYTQVLFYAFLRFCPLFAEHWNYRTFPTSPTSRGMIGISGLQWSLPIRKSSLEPNSHRWESKFPVALCAEWIEMELFQK